MVSPSQLASWQPARLTEIAEEVLRNRRVLTGLHDELDRGAPPASWTFADAEQARSTHRALAEQLATQVSETVGVIEALDTAAAAITAAKRLLDGAMHRAGANGFQVDRSTGLVRIVRAFDDAADHAYARSVRNEVAEQAETALRDADAADQALAAALTRAATTDVNDVGTLAQQQALLDFQKKSPAEQTAYLLAHPEEYAFLGGHVSDAVKTRIGESIANDLDEMARAPERLGDATKVADVTRLLAAFGGDPDVAAPLYQRLGADGLLGTLYGVGNLLYVDVNAEALGGLAAQLRSGLQTASIDSDFDGEGFGRDLARYATGTASGATGDAFDSAFGSGPGAASVLDYLMRGGDYGGDFVRGVAEGLDGFERGEPESVLSWIEHNSTTPFNALDPAVSGPCDVMATVMGQLSRHPDAGLDFFTDDPERSGYYFGERDWSRDGFGSIAQVALSIGTDPENIANASEATGKFVASVVDSLPDNPAFTVEKARAASEPLADLLKHYMPSARVALIDGGSADGGALVDTLNLDCFPQLHDQPVFSKLDVKAVLGVALSTEDGLARVAEGVANFRQTTLANYAALVESGDPSVSSFNVQNLLNDSMTLEGSVQEVVASTAIEGARSKDQQVAAFTDLVSKAVKAVPVPGGKIVDVVWAEVRQLSSDEVRSAFADNESVMRAHQTDEAVDGKVKAAISSYLALVEAGVADVPPELRDTWMPDGELITLGDIDPALLGVRRSDAMSAIAGQIVALNLDTAYWDPFRPPSTAKQT
jgi:hypothetical protein